MSNEKLLHLPVLRVPELQDGLVFFATLEHPD
jgi:hypothetical protein